MIAATSPIEIESPFSRVTGTWERIKAIQARGTLLIDPTSEYVVAVVVDKNHREQKEIPNAQIADMLPAMTKWGLFATP